MSAYIRSRGGVDECCIVLYDDAWTKNTRCVDLFFSKLQSQLLSDGHGSSVSLTSYRLKTLNNGVARDKQSGSKAWCVDTCGNYLDYTEQLTMYIQGTVPGISHKTLAQGRVPDNDFGEPQRPLSQKLKKESPKIARPAAAATPYSEWLDNWPWTDQTPHGHLERPGSVEA